MANPGPGVGVRHGLKVGFSGARREPSGGLYALQLAASTLPHVPEYAGGIRMDALGASDVLDGAAARYRGHGAAQPACLVPSSRDGRERLLDTTRAPPSAVLISIETGWIVLCTRRMP
jgi:hypothetical protein